MPLLVKQGDNVLWVDAIEAALEAGFDDIHCAETGAVSIIFIAKGVDDPVRDGGSHVVPRAENNEPDDEPPDHWRPVIHLHQGRPHRLRRGDRVRSEAGRSRRHDTHEEAARLRAGERF